MNVKTRKILTVSTLAIVLCTLAVGAAATLLCWLTPSVSVMNLSGTTLSNVALELPSNRWDLEDLAPGNRSHVFYDANQSDGSYTVKLQQDGKTLTLRCGHVTHSEWGKRMQIRISDQGKIECQEKHRY